MPRGTQLSAHERGKIDAFHQDGVSQAGIARRIGRSRAVVQNYLKDPARYGTISRKPRRSKLTLIGKRHLLREASKGTMSANNLRKALSLPVSTRWVQHLLHNSENLVYKKMKSSPMLLERHKKGRVEWCAQHVTKSIVEWGKVVFSDEKKFNLDGPDGFAYYWHDLRREEKVFSKRQNGGGSVMVWGGFSFNGKTALAILDGNQNAEDYTNTLQEYLLPFAASKHPGDWHFVQDGASIHTAKETAAWLDSRNISVLGWPAKSPDLNPIENLWGVLARVVYANARQFSNVTELSECIMEAWDDISGSYLKKLVESMPKRCVEVLQRRGQKTKY